MKKDNKYEGYVYRATCVLNNKCYIGQTTRSFNRRKTEHLSAARSLVHKGRRSHFYSAIQKHGEENFTWEIIETVQHENRDILYDKLFELEIYYIEKYDSFLHGYNLNLGGWGSKGTIPSEETRQKLRLINLGRKMSEETKEILRSQRVGKSLSEEHKEKIRIKTKEACENNPERSEKIRISRESKIKVYTEDGVLLNSFKSIKDGAEFYNIDSSYISKNCKRKAQTSGKYNNLRLIWRYAEDEFTEEDKKILKPVIVEVYDISNNFIREFNCAKDVCEFYSITSGEVSNVLNNKRNYCSTGNNERIVVKYKIFN